MFIISSLFVKLSEFCEAPRVPPTSLENMTLTYVGILSRHGHRSPELPFLNVTERGNWECDDGMSTYTEYVEPPHVVHTGVYNPSTFVYFPSCQGGQLTLIGKKQLKDLGAMYRQHYVDDLHYLPEFFNKTEIKVKSSPVDRAFASAIEFMNGLYPPNYANGIFKINAGKSRASPLNLDVVTCKEYKKVKSDFRAGHQYEKLMDEVWPILEPAAKRFQLNKTVINFRKICSWTTAFNCATDAPRPDFFTNEFLESCLREQVLSKFGVIGSSKYRAVGASPLFRMFFKDIDKAEKKGTKLTYYSAHDATIVAILSFLGKFRKYVPPYASHLVMEIYKDANAKKYIRFFLNGENFKVEGFENILIPYEEFKDFCTPRLIYCHEIPY